MLSNPKEAHWEKRPFDNSDLGTRWVPYEKIREGNSTYYIEGSWLDSKFSNSQATAELKQIFAGKTFDTPKPVGLVSWLLGLIDDADSIILDSFAGSGTTAHAVLKQNAEDGGNRKFILVEMEEKIAAEITAERVRRGKWQGPQKKSVYF